MSAQIHLAAKNCKLTADTEGRVRERVEAFHDRYRSTRVFQVTVHVEDEIWQVGIRTWRNAEIQPSSFASIEPDYQATASGENVFSAVDAVLRSLQQDLKNQASAERPKKRFGWAWYQSPLIWGGVVLILIIVGFLWMQPRSQRGLVPVTGKVTIQDVALPNAQVVFHPTDRGRPAVAMSDENGMFEITAGYRGSSGAYPGEYRVTVTLADEVRTGTDPASDLTEFVEQAEEKRADEESAMLRGKIPEPPKSRVHANYTNVVLTPLKITVPTNGTVNLKLTKDGK